MEFRNFNQNSMNYNCENRNCTLNSSRTTPSYEGVILIPEPNLLFLILVLLPAACIFGNFLVVLAIVSEKGLKTSTNFLLLSLACADLLVGILVMPFSVYLTINRLNWFLPEAICNFFCVADVSASTASIVHLVAISVDRFYAVVRHMEYKSPKHKRRINCTILFIWIFSIGIGLPLGIGMNQTTSSDSKEPYRCGIVNPDYMLYMSIFSFYIPCLVMSVMYGFVFYRLHSRMRAVRLQEMAASQICQFGDNLGNIFQSAYGNTTRLRQASVMWAIPFLQDIEATMAENEDMSTDELDELTVILHTLESDPRSRFKDKSVKGHSRGLFKSTHVRVSSILANARQRLSKRGNQIRTMNKNNDTMDSDKGHNGTSGPENNALRRRPSLYMAKQKIKTLKDRAIELVMRLRSRQGMAIRKETRATKLVATVMLVFLLCYMPFFTLNLIKVFMLRTNTWNYDLEGLFMFFTWLGYVNSCLNPLIYSLFNRKFRAAFQKLLHCAGDESNVSLARQKRLSKIIGDSDDKKSWILSQKRTSSPAKRFLRINRGTPTEKVSPSHQNGVQKHTEAALSRNCTPDNDLTHLPRIIMNRGGKSKFKIRSSESRSSKSSSDYSMKSEDIEMDIMDDEISDSDYDADEEPSSKCQTLPRVIDTELIMLRKAQFTGYTLLFDQNCDLNEPVEV